MSIRLIERIENLRNNSGHHAPPTAEAKLILRATTPLGSQLLEEWAPTIGNTEAIRTLWAEQKLPEQENPYPSLVLRFKNGQDNKEIFGEHKSRMRAFNRALASSVAHGHWSAHNGRTSYTHTIEVYLSEADRDAALRRAKRLTFLDAVETLSVSISVRKLRQAA